MKKRMISAVLAAAMCGSLITPASAVVWTEGAEEPDVQALYAEDGLQTAGRQVLNFNKDWTFHLGEMKGAEATDFDDSDWRTLNLPHDYSIEQDFNLSSEAKAGGGFLDGGPAWYRKTWVIPASMAGKRITIDFDGVYMDSDVYVNGKHVGNYPYGYSPFSYDITDYVIADGMTENVIAVHTNNQQPSSRWYSGSGIYRDVQLTVTDPVHISRYGTKVTTPDLEAEYTGGQDVSVHVGTTLENEGTETSNVSLRHTIYFDGSLEQEGSEAAVATVNTEAVELAPGAQQTVDAVLSVSNPVLWQVGVGGMYRVHTEVLAGDTVIDDYDTPFGMRWMKFDPQNGFFINGEYTKIHGVCQHHDQGAMGAVNNQTALDRQIRILREMGVNAIRSSHNPASRALLDACNEQGIMVMNEAFDCWWSPKNNYDFHRFFDTPCTHPDAKEGQTWQEFDIKNMVNSAKNDPCVIMWSIGNEIGESWSEQAVTVGNQLRSWVKEVDDTRAVTQADPIFYELNEAAYDPANNQPHWRLINGHDAMGFNYGKYTHYDKVHEMNPDWFIYSSETSSAVATRGSYFHPEVDEDQDAGLHRGTYECSEFDNDCVNWGTTLHYALREDAKRKYMGGLFFWTGFDYIGEPAPFAGGSSKSSYFGSIDTCGFPKDSYYLIQSQWLDVETDPMVHLLPHWNWENDTSITYDDGTMPIRVYSNARSVEVFLNGESLGMKSFTYHPETETSLAYQDDGSEQENLYLEWRVPYAPGTVEAVAYDAEGNEIARDTMTTAGDPAALKLMPEETVITADGEDLCYIPVDVVDENGVMNPRANVPIQFSITGNGRIVGTDNGSPTDFTNMKSTDRSSFHGKALVIVQSTQKGGSFTLTATAPGLKSDSVTIFTAEEDYETDTLLGYEAVSVVTPVGVQPQLPETVTAVYLGGKTQPMGVTWDAIDGSKLEKADRFTVNGTVTETGDTIRATVEVVAPVGVRPVSVVTQPGVQPELPAEVTLVYSDGAQSTYPVTWDAIADEALVDGALLTVAGTLDGIDLKAVAYVRVSVGTRKNIAPDATFTASHTSDYDPIAHINDGIISFDTSPKNGWGNWKYPPIPEVTTLDMTLDTPTTLDSITFYFREDGGIYIPKDTLIQYWDAETQAWVDVTNQSQRDGFVSGEAQTVTFDPVVTTQLRAQFTRGEQDTSGGKKDCMVLTEVEVYANVPDSGSDVAKLASLSVGGEALEDFDPDKTLYTITLPYGADVPEITAEAEDHGTVFIQPAVTNQSAALITVTSESGKNVKEYVIQFKETPAALTSATLRLDAQEVHEDDIVPIHVDALLENGELADEELLKVTYEVLNAGVPAKAAVKNGSLYAYGEGTVQVQAHITYLGKTITSAPLEVTIQGSDELKTILSYAQVTVYTNLGQAPALPETVLATFDIGLYKDVAVTWDPVDPAQYNRYGTFTVRGTVENQALHPTATVVVRDGAAAQNVSTATPVGIKPTLPATVEVYFTDGTSTVTNVTWDSYDEELLKTEQTFTVNGVTELGEFPVTASVRVTSDTIQSENHAKNRNGCPYSKAITTFSEGGSAVALNDGLLNKWTDWGNPNPNGDLWIGVIFGADYPELRYVDTLVLDLLRDSSWDRTKVQDVTVEYYNQPITLEDVPQNVANFDNPDLADHPFNNPDNWTEVSNLQQPAPDEWVEQGENVMTFDMVQTYAIRIKINHADPEGIDRYTAVRELYAYGKQANFYQDAAGDTLTVNGTPLEGFDPAVYEYTVSVDGSEVPELAMTAAHNGAVTYIPAPNIDGVARFIVTSEDGLKTQTYTISFESTYPRYQVFVTNGAAYRAAAAIAMAQPNEIVEKYAPGEQVVLVADAPENGMVFDQWVFETPMDGVDVTQNPLTITMPDHDVTVEATYTQRDLTDAEAVAAAKAKVGDSVEVPSGEYADNNALAAAAQQIVQTLVDEYGVTAAVTYENDGFVLRLSKGEAGSTVSPFSVTVQSTVTVTFDSNGGSAVDTQEVSIGGQVVRPADPTNGDFEFDGWYTDEACTAPFDFGTAIEKDLTLYAGWKMVGPSVDHDDDKEEPEEPEEPENPDIEEPDTPLNPTPGFTDVAYDFWGKEAIDYVVAEGLMNGTSETTFAPNVTTTRAMLMTILARMDGVDTTGSDPWYAKGMEWAVAEGVSDGTNPEGTITREQLAVMLYRYSGSPAVSNDTLTFADADAVSDWAVDGVKWAVANGILSGKGNNTLDPQGNATRAEVAQMIFNFSKIG